MRKRNLIAAGIITALLLTGCQSGTNTSSDNTSSAAIQEQAVTSTQPETATDTSTDNTTEAPADGAAESDGTETASTGTPADTSAAQTDLQKDTGVVTYTFEELTALVTAFEEKVAAAAPTGTDSDLETFFSLKQEENQIDDALDLYEDALELQYRNGTLTREDCKTQERELEQLEDILDRAEDDLEFTFGIDD